MIRKPAVAGQFYPEDGKKLRAAIAGFSPDVAKKKPALGVLCPHAGYVFSGPVAAEVFAGIEVPPVAVILNPSHNYHDPPFALWEGRGWETPLGEVPIHRELNAGLASLAQVTKANRVHEGEHAAEVVLPFLQYHRPDVQIAVICVTAGASRLSLRELGRGIASSLGHAGADDALVIASSDMSHEQGRDALDTVNANDPPAIAQMERLDAEGLLRTCSEKGISMCGALPAVAMMESVRARGGEQGKLVRRATSADSPYGRGDYVVGYAGMIFT